MTRDPLGGALRSYEMQATSQSFPELLAEYQRLRADSERLLDECRMAMVVLRQSISKTKQLLTERPDPGLRKVVEISGGSTEQTRLSRRERDVLRCIAEGNSTKQIADKIGISYKTASCYRYRMMEKLAIHDIAGLIRFAIRTEIIRA